LTVLQLHRMCFCDVLEHRSNYGMVLRMLAFLCDTASMVRDTVKWTLVGLFYIVASNIPWFGSTRLYGWLSLY